MTQEEKALETIAKLDLWLMEKQFKREKVSIMEVRERLASYFT